MSYNCFFSPQDCNNEHLDKLSKQYSCMFDLCGPMKGCATTQGRHLFMEGDLKYKDSINKVSENNRKFDVIHLPSKRLRLYNSFHRLNSKWRVIKTKSTNKQSPTFNLVFRLRVFFLHKQHTISILMSSFWQKVTSALPQKMAWKKFFSNKN